jgi:hypothetical protein
MRVSTQEIRIPAPRIAAQESKRLSSRIRSLLIAGLIACAGILFAHLLIRSRHWEHDHDTPLLQYCGFLMDRYGWMPYRADLPGHATRRARSRRVISPHRSSKALRHC